MSVLWIENRTAKSHDLVYTFSDGGMRTRTIPPGKRLAIPDEAAGAAADIVAQHTKYGLVTRDAATTAGLAVLCYWTV
jgi:hypothetical protein